jgi:hypothetical protein
MLSNNASENRKITVYRRNAFRRLFRVAVKAQHAPHEIYEIYVNINRTRPKRKDFCTTDRVPKNSAACEQPSLKMIKKAKKFLNHVF